MSAISGIFDRKGGYINKLYIKRMNNALNHRGIDGCRIWCGDSVSFGHQMLHTTKESLKEELPFEDHDSGLVITSDARIDNRHELADKLSFDEEDNLPDSIFILKSYEKWGERCPEKLLGDFAFVIWDKDNKKIFCARDHLGIKSFYYHLSNLGFFFSSEIKAFFTIPQIQHQLNDKKLAFHLLNVFTDKKYTFYDSIFTLPAAHSLVVNENFTKMRKYWKLDPELKIEMDSEEEYFQAFRDLFSEAVNCRLRSSFQPGFELSGGLDSSSIVCMARKIINRKQSLMKKDIETFSMVFNDFPQVDESYYVKKVTDIDGIKPNFVYSDKISPLENIKTILWHQEQPFYTPNMSMLWNMYHKMKKKDIRVVLVGAGGDQTINLGRNYFHDLATTIQWKILLRELRCYAKNSKVNLDSLFFEQVLIPLIPMPLKNILKYFINLIKHRKTEDKYAILNKNFVNKFGGKNYFNKFFERPTTAREYHNYVINNTSHQYFLEARDKLSSAFGIECRYPFYDKRLIEFCYGIPDEMKFKYGWNRYTQRMAMENILPPEIQWRYIKKFFNPVYERNLLLFEESRLEKIFTKNFLMEDYVNLDIINTFYKKYKSGNGNVRTNIELWLFILLDLWLRESNIIQV